MYISSNTIAFLHNQTLCFCTTCETTDIKHCPFFIYGWKMKHIKRSPLKRKKLLLICKKLFLPNKICVHKSLFYWKISMHTLIVFFFFFFFSFIQCGKFVFLLKFLEKPDAKVNVLTFANIFLTKASHFNSFLMAVLMI